jgi:putative spermidine/putrescine transport system permease protein
MNKGTLWSLFWVVLGATYLFVPLYGTLDFSLKARKGGWSLAAYENVLNDPKFLNSFVF